jgi:hypothetical protein
MTKTSQPNAMTRCDQVVKDVEESRSWLMLLLVAAKFADFFDEES